MTERPAPLMPWASDPFGALDGAALAVRWRAAAPFPHVVLDDWLPSHALAQLRAGLARERHFPEANHLFELMGSAEQPEQPELVAFNAALCSPASVGFVRALSGLDLSHGHLRSTVYLPGHFLLPHTDWDPRHDRRVAVVLYLSDPEAFSGGELELFVSEAAGERPRAAPGAAFDTAPPPEAGWRSARTIGPRAGRLVMFEVSRWSLHRVREVLGGARASLSGWYYA